MRAYHKAKVATTVQGKSYPDAFHTDHTVLVTVKDNGTGLTTLVNDSLHIGYDYDVTDGLLRQSMPSDKVTITLGAPAEQQVLGFDLELAKVVHATK